MPLFQPPPVELYNACRIIFGPEVTISIEFLKYLQPIGLKTAYRKRALETHPDRAKTLGILPLNLNEEFRNVRLAYEKLLIFVETKNKKKTSCPTGTGFRTRGSPNQASGKSSKHYTSQYANQSRQQHTASQYSPAYHIRQKSPADHFYKGYIPQRSLLIGQFLYYSRLISWRTLIQAVSWQRWQRPKIGQIAIAWGLLSSHDIMRVLTERILNERFAECALRIGYISHFEQIALIGKQRKMQRPIGEYFVKNGFLSERDMLCQVTGQKVHNRKTFR